MRNISTKIVTNNLVQNAWWGILKMTGHPTRSYLDILLTLIIPLNPELVFRVPSDCLRWDHQIPSEAIGGHRSMGSQEGHWGPCKVQVSFVFLVTFLNIDLTIFQWEQTFVIFYPINTLLIVTNFRLILHFS